MSKTLNGYIGIDVAKATLQVHIRKTKGEGRDLTFDNNEAGHKALVKAVGKRSYRVVLEPTGTYHFDLALHLAARPNLSVMVVQPKAAKDFASALMSRAKNDRVDAIILAELAERGRFVAWNPPPQDLLELRETARLLRTTSVDRTRLINRIEGCLSARVRGVLEAQKKSIEAVLKQLEELVDELMKASSASSIAEAIQEMPGFAVRSTGYVLGEFASLPKDLAAKQVVAFAGLDPRQRDSGRREGKRRISRVGNKVLRHALYMPSLHAIRRIEPLKAFYERLVERGKPKKVAIVAVMRKLLTILWRMYQTGDAFDPQKIRPVALTN